MLCDSYNSKPIVSTLPSPNLVNYHTTIVHHYLIHRLQTHNTKEIPTCGYFSTLRYYYDGNMYSTYCQCNYIVLNLNHEKSVYVLLKECFKMYTIKTWLTKLTLDYQEFFRLLIKNYYPVHKTSKPSYSVPITETMLAHINLKAINFGA